MTFKEKYEAGFYRGLGPMPKRKDDERIRAQFISNYDDRTKAEFLRVIRIHFRQGVFACHYCIDRRAGYCEGKGYCKFDEVARCINKNHFGGKVCL